MNARYLRMAVALWIVALVVGGYAESFPNRPTADEMNQIVALGTECIRGLNERCLATQYQTNPIAYQVAPFTNTTFYLDQSLMGAMATNIRSLVSYYVDTNTVYDGTTNIVMLTFTGLLTSLNLGDHTNFTSIPCWTNNVGQTNCTTNAATFGPWAWRNYIVAWQERYKVLEALKVRTLGSYAGTTFPEVVRSATIEGSGMITGGYCSVWYSLYTTELGPANGTEYNIDVTTRTQLGDSAANYISFGYNMAPWGGPGNALGIILDVTGGTNVVEFSSTLNLLGDVNYVRILNSWLLWSHEPNNTSASHSQSQASVSASLKQSLGGVADFAIYGVIYFPFQYCTNSWWN